MMSPGDALFLVIRSAIPCVLVGLAIAFSHNDHNVTYLSFFATAAVMNLGTLYLIALARGVILRQVYAYAMAPHLFSGGKFPKRRPARGLTRGSRFRIEVVIPKKQRRSLSNQNVRLFNEEV